MAEFPEDRIVPSGLDQGKDPLQDGVHDHRGVPHVQIRRIQYVPQVEFWIVIQATAAKPLIAFWDRPGDHVSDSVVIEVQVERYRVVQPDVLSIDRVALDHTQGESDNPSALAPKKEAYFVRH